MKKWSFVLLITTCVIIGCKPELKEIGDHYPAGEGIYGTWELKSVVQIDESLIVPESRDVSRYYTSVPSRKMIIRFDRDKKYAVVQAGALPLLLGTEGSWSYDASPYPTKVLFYSLAGDTLAAPLKGMPRETDQVFGFNINRTDTCGKAYLTYELQFDRAQ